MSRTTLISLCVAVAFALPAAAAGRKTVFLDKMGGLEAYIEKAAGNQELGVEFIEEAEHPDLKVLLGKKFTSVHAEVLYRKNTGRNEDSTLQVVDVKTRKPILTFDFKWSGDEAARQRVASDFVRQLKEKLR
jgi:hypothetical protein